jgi:RluA family pseudouridine synthase
MLHGGNQSVTLRGRSFSPGFMPIPPLIFEDETLLAFDKPAGVGIAPAHGNGGRESLMAAIRARFGDGVANVHRLDPEASGVFLCAKTKPALDFLSGQFQSKTAGKKYLSLIVLLAAEGALKDLAPIRAVNGTLPDSFTIDLPLREDEDDRSRLRVGKGRGSKESFTEFRVLERFGRFVWLECRPVTSATHQLRVHLAALGAPVVNDAIYGDPEAKLLLSDLKRGYKGRDEEKPLLSRLALHASELTVKHPTSREPLTLVSPLPHEFEVALKYLRKFK